MSLYNNVSDSLLSRGLVGSLNAAVTGALGATGDAVSNALGGGRVAQAVTKATSSAAAQVATKALNKAIPPKLRGQLDTFGRVSGSAMTGDWEGAAMYAIEGGVLDGLMGSLGGFAKQERYRGKKTPMLGGASLSEVQRVHNEVMAANHVRKNLFFIEVSSYAEGDISEVFNLLCVDVDYAPFQVRADKQAVGGAMLDLAQGQEAVEMRFTTYDNGNGDLKRFFARHHARVAARDGTVGLPAQYALHIKIVDGIVGGGNSVSSTYGGYTDEGLFRVTSLEKSMSRREQALQELQLSFSQLDTFMKP